MAVLVVVVFLGSITGSSFKVTYGDFEKCNGNGRTDRTDCAIDILNHGNTVKEIEITTGGVTKGICVKSPDKCAAFRGLVV